MCRIRLCVRARVQATLPLERVETETAKVPRRVVRWIVFDDVGRELERALRALIGAQHGAKVVHAVAKRLAVVDRANWFRACVRLSFRRQKIRHKKTKKKREKGYVCAVATQTARKRARSTTSPSFCGSG